MVVEWKLQTNHAYFILFYFVDAISKKINRNNIFKKNCVIKNGLKKKNHEHTWNLNILGLRSFILNHKRKYHLLSYWSNNNFVKAFGLYGLVQHILILRKSPNLRNLYQFVFVVKTSWCLKIYRKYFGNHNKNYGWTINSFLFGLS